jgi:hypothetical protein
MRTLAKYLVLFVLAVLLAPFPLPGIFANDEDDEE